MSAPARPRAPRDERRRRSNSSRRRSNPDRRRAGTPKPAARRPAARSAHQPTCVDAAAVSRAAGVASFADTGLPDRLLQALARQGLTRPFAIQGLAIPDALAGRDVLGRAATGSGKTLAFGLPLLARLAGVRAAAGRPLGLVVLPTRELAMQVVDALRPYAQATDVRVRLVAGGMPYAKQIDALRRGVELLVATPGRLIDLLDRGECRLDAIRTCVLDEADQMCDMGFAPAIRRLLDATAAGGQRMLFSATLDGDVDAIVRRYLTDPAVHATAPVTATLTAMDHHLFVVQPADKEQVTAELAARDGRTIVFVATKRGADKVATRLRGHGVQAAALHGGLAQGARTRTLTAFKDGHVPVLVATDVAARGLHVDDVGLVIQSDPAGDHKTYLHRAGRTARAGGSGAVVTLAMPSERRDTEKLTRAAGVSVTPAYVRSGHARVAELAGGATPSGTPVAAYQPAPAPPRRTGRGRNRSSRRPAGAGQRRR